MRIPSSGPQQTGATYDPAVLDNPTNESLLEQLDAATSTAAP